MAKLVDLLKEKGWTDEKITAAFADPGMIAILDDMMGTVTSERDALKARDQEWERKLNEDYNPAISRAEKEAAEARRRAADFEEQLKIAKDYGYMPAENDADKKLREAAEAAAARGNDSYDRKLHPTFDDVAKFADAEAEAIALANDLAAEYQYLNPGKSLYEYETTINGQQMRGMRALRQEAKAARKPLDQYTADKFDFAGKRKAQAEARQKEHDDRIRAEATEATRREMAEKYGNPMLAQPVSSRVPFMPAKTSDGKQPWDVPANQRRAERIKRNTEIQLNSERVQ